MIIKIPTVKKTWNEESQKMEVIRDEMRVDIDTSFKAHLKWEEQFSSTVGCDLSTYTERVKAWVKDPQTAKAQLLGLLKLLFCYVNSDALPTFKEFVSLFDVDVADHILSKINIVLEEASKTAAKN